MKWVAKAAAQRVLSALPAGDRMNYVLQKHVTRQFPRSDEHFRLHGVETTRHFRSLHRHLSDVPTAEICLYEYGAGWDLIGPLVFWGLGVEHQTLVDIRPNLRFEQFNRTVLQYERLREQLENQASVQLRSVDPHPVDSLDELRIRFGIHYLAPRDARATGLDGDSLDFVSSTYTLEHIPRRDIVAILAESRRLLRPGGLVSSTIDMRDHFSFFDPAISAYNFLKFGDRAWALVNSPLQFQNRLRLPDHRALHTEAGLEIVDEGFEEPSPKDVEQVRSLALGPRFRHNYSVEELAVREVHILARKPANVRDFAP